MKKFKYPLAIKGTKEQLLTFFSLLEELGYEDDPSCGSSYKLNDCLYLITNFGAIVDSIGFNQSNDGQMEVSADNPELVLALAAAVEGGEFHEGEWIYTNPDSRGWGMCHEDEGKLFKILNVDPLQEYEWLELDRTSNKTTYTVGRVRVRSKDVRKATKEEIINHFNMDNKCCGVSPQEKTYTVKESFVKAAHASACSEWKEKIEKEFPEMFHLEYDENKIYAFHSYGATYKLHKIDPGNKIYVWVSIGNSECWANGEHKGANVALNSSGHIVSVFNNEKEFAKWILNN